MEWALKLEFNLRDCDLDLVAEILAPMLRFGPHGWDFYTLGLKAEILGLTRVLATSEWVSRLGFRSMAGIEHGD